MAWYSFRTRREPATDSLKTSLPPSENALDPSAQPLAARITALEAQLSQLQLAWSETLEKLTSWGNRQAARERRRADRALDQLGDPPADGPETHEDAPGATNGGELDSGSLAHRAARKAQLRAQFRR